MCIRDSAPAQLGLLDRRLEGRPLHLVERLPDLPDLGRAEVQRGRLGRHVHGLAAPQPEHHGGQPGAGELLGGVAQRDQLAGQPPADPVRDHDREDHREQPDRTGDAAAHERTVRVSLRAGADGRPQPGVQVGQVAQGRGGEVVVAAHERAPGRLRPVAVRLEQRLVVGQVRPVAADSQVVVVGLVLRVELAHVDAEQRALVVQPVQGRLDHPRVRHGGDSQALDRGVLLGEVLAGPHQLDQDRALPGQLTVLPADERGPEGEDGLDQVGVLADHQVPAVRLPVDLAPEGGQLVGGVQDVLEPGQLAPAELRGVRAGGLVAQQLEVAVGHRPGLLVGVTGRLGAGVGEPEHGRPALVLEVPGVLVGGVGEALVRRADVQLGPDVPGGHQGRVDPEAGERDDGHHEQRDDLRADRAAAQTHGVLGGERARRGRGCGRGVLPGAAGTGRTVRARPVDLRELTTP